MPSVVRCTGGPSPRLGTSATHNGSSDLTTIAGGSKRPVSSGRREEELPAWLGRGLRARARGQEELRQRSHERPRRLLLPRLLELADVLVHDRLDLDEVARAPRRDGPLVDLDRPLGHQRQVHRHVARDLELAEQHAHQRLHRGVARRARERQVELDVELQEAVLLLERTARVDQRPHGVDRALQRREVLLGGPHGGQLGDARLEHPPRLQHAGDLAEAQGAELADELDADDVGGDEHAAAGAAADLQQAGFDEDLDGLAQRRPADLHLRGEGPLARKLVADPQLTDADLVRDLLGRLLEGPTRLHRREHAGNIHAYWPVVSPMDLFFLCGSPVMARWATDPRCHAPPAARTPRPRSRCRSPAAGRRRRSCRRRPAGWTPGRRPATPRRRRRGRLRDARSWLHPTPRPRGGRRGVPPSCGPFAARPDRVRIPSCPVSPRDFWPSAAWPPAAPPTCAAAAAAPLPSRRPRRPPPRRRRRRPRPRPPRPSPRSRRRLPRRPARRSTRRPPAARPARPSARRPPTLPCPSPTPPPRPPPPKRPPPPRPGPPSTPTPTSSRARRRRPPPRRAASAGRAWTTPTATRRWRRSTRRAAAGAGASGAPRTSSSGKPPTAAGAPTPTATPSPPQAEP